MWYAKKTSADQGLIVDDETGRTVAVTYNAEDAPVVAASRELLATLEKLLPLWDREDVADTWSPEFEAAQAAIAKAKGE